MKPDEKVASPPVPAAAAETVDLSEFLGPMTEATEYQRIIQTLGHQLGRYRQHGDDLQRSLQSLQVENQTLRQDSASLRYHIRKSDNNVFHMWLLAIVLVIVIIVLSATCATR